MKSNKPVKPTPRSSGSKGWEEPRLETWEIVGGIALGLICMMAIILSGAMER